MNIVDAMIKTIKNKNGLKAEGNHGETRCYYCDHNDYAGVRIGYVCMNYYDAHRVIIPVNGDSACNDFREQREVFSNE